MSNWKEKAVELSKLGVSWRKIAQQLDKPKSSVSDYLRKVFKDVEVKEAEVSKGPRILLYDIERLH